MSNKRMMFIFIGLLAAMACSAASARADDNNSAQDQKTAPTFESLDKNHDGRLTRSEIPHDMHTLRRQFHSYDRDGNGSLSKREYEAYLHKSEFRRLP